ncbi:MAG: zinc-binding dehydrogenase [Chitinophagaceae bacterium]
MKTKAVRLYSKNDLRLEEFELPAIKENEILAKVFCDSLCMSSYKASKQGEDHTRVPNDVKNNPVIIGHEFSGEILEVGNKWQSQFSVGQKFAIQPALNYEGGPVGLLSAPGYSYSYIGGDATFIIIPNEVMEMDCLLTFGGSGYYTAALTEPLSCVIGAMQANYHTTPGSYAHTMGTVDGGTMAILAGVGPMGLTAINYVINGKTTKPKLLVVTDVNQDRLNRAASLYSVKDAEKAGIELKYINTGESTNPVEHLLQLTDGKGFNDVFVFAPVPAVIEQADAILAYDGCLNFFAGPSNTDFKAPFNFYNVHYNATHIVGTSGGNNSDMKEAIALVSKGFDLAGLITHIGGLDAVINATLNLPNIPGGKKLIYTDISLELTALEDFEEKGKTNLLFRKLFEIISENNGLWSVAAEKYLMENWNKNPV